jgi:DNA-directed RNA polymerase alpha subunit
VSQSKGGKRRNDWHSEKHRRKSLRESEAREAMSDHDDAEKAFHETGSACGWRGWRGRSWLVRCFIQPPGLLDETLIDNVRFSTRIANALNAAGVKTVGEIRQASNATLLTFQDLGASSIARLRETFGPAPSRTLKPKGKKPT